MTEPTEAGSPAPPPPDDDRPRWGDRRDRRARGVDKAGVIWGVILLAVGVWFFLDNTLGLTMPSLDWGDVWPIILIVAGALVLYQGWRRRTD